MKTAAELRVAKIQIHKQRESEVRHKALNLLKEREEWLERRLIEHDEAQLAVGDFFPPDDCDRVGETLVDELGKLGYHANYNPGMQLLDISVPSEGVTYRELTRDLHAPARPATLDSERDGDWGRDEEDARPEGGFGKNVGTRSTAA